MYKFYNANAIGNRANDCVVRAISVAEGKSWDETYEELSDIAQEQGILLDDVNFVEEYLDNRYRRVPHMSKTVGEAVEEFSKGTYLITMEGHITVVVDGILYDTFDCRDRIIRCIWYVPKRRNKRL